MHGIQEIVLREKTFQSDVLFGLQTAIVGLIRMDEYSFGWLARLNRSTLFHKNKILCQQKCTKQKCNSPQVLKAPMSHNAHCSES